METKEYKLLDGRTIRAKYDRLGMCKISKENLEAFTKEFNRSYRQGKILEKIKENYALMKADERKKGKWIEIAEYSDGMHKIECSECKNHIFDRGHANSINVKNKYKYCPNCGTKMENEDT